MDRPNILVLLLKIILMERANNIALMVIVIKGTSLMEFMMVQGSLCLDRVNINTKANFQREFLMEMAL